MARKLQSEKNIQCLSPAKKYEIKKNSDCEIEKSACPRQKNITTQAREGIETTFSFISPIAPKVTTQAREGIETSWRIC